MTALKEKEIGLRQDGEGGRLCVQEKKKSGLLDTKTERVSASKELP